MSFSPLTRAQAHYIKQLKYKKYRIQEEAFLVEGKKSVQELLASDYKIRMIVTTTELLEEAGTMLTHATAPILTTSPNLLAQISALKHNQHMLAVATMQPNKPLVVQPGERALVVDHLQDPGNLGTMMRIAHWYGIKKLICSPTTVDRYNTKVIQASMGSFTQVHTYYTPLEPFLKAAQVPIIGAVVQSKHHLNTTQLPFDGMLLIGNESQGIDTALYPLLDLQVSIRSHSKVDSLNAAIAAAIVCERWCNPIL